MWLGEKEGSFLEIAIFIKLVLCFTHPILWKMEEDVSLPWEQENNPEILGDCNKYRFILYYIYMCVCVCVCVCVCMNIYIYIYIYSHTHTHIYKYIQTHIHTHTCRKPWFDSWVGKIPWRRDRLPTSVFMGFPGVSDIKESTCNVEDPGSSLGWDALEEGTPWRRAWQPTPVFLSEESPWTEEPGRL